MWPLSREASSPYCGCVTGRVRFGLFEFDPDDGTLIREGVPVRLQPQPARVLALLVRRAGTVVTRDELRQQVWSDGTFVDFERGLNFCVAQIRGALGDSADSPRFIETLPRRGYRFIAPLGPVATEVEPPRKPPPRRRAVLLLVAAVTSLAVAGAVWRLAVRAEPVRVAVVPFDNETGSPGFEDIARGVADATVARLATPERVERLSVVGNAAVLNRPRGFRDLRLIGEQVGADYVVLAQVKRDESGVRLIAHLIRVEDEAHVWASTFDRPAFTLAVQAEIAEEIALAVSSRLAGR